MRKDIVEKKFEEWTKGLSSEESRIRIFERIRDIPFAIVLELFSLKKGPGEMLVRNKGFCVPKHHLLGMMYQRLGVPVRYCTYSFRWNELGADYPADLKEQADIVIFDSPPALAVTDATVLSSQVDGVLLVVDAGSCRRGLAAWAVESLSNVGGTVLGAVLNRLSPVGETDGLSRQDLTGSANLSGLGDDQAREQRCGGVEGQGRQ